MLNTAAQSLLKCLLPCLLQDTRGFGWPSAIHSITTGRPRITVVLRGGATITTFRFSVGSVRRRVQSSNYSITDSQPASSLTRRWSPSSCSLCLFFGVDLAHCNQWVWKVYFPTTLALRGQSQHHCCVTRDDRYYKHRTSSFYKWIAYINY